MDWGLLEFDVRCSTNKRQFQSQGNLRWACVARSSKIWFQNISCGTCLRDLRIPAISLSTRVAAWRWIGLWWWSHLCPCWRRRKKINTLYQRSISTFPLSPHPLFQKVPNHHRRIHFQIRRIERFQWGNLVTQACEKADQHLAEVNAQTGRDRLWGPKVGIKRRLAKIWQVETLPRLVKPHLLMLHCYLRQPQLHSTSFALAPKDWIPRALYDWIYLLRFLCLLRSKFRLWYRL